MDTAFCKSGVSLRQAGKRRFRVPGSRRGIGCGKQCPVNTSTWIGPIVTACLLAGSTACGSGSGYIPTQDKNTSASGAPTGSIADINRKTGGAKGKQSGSAPAVPAGTIVLLVAHDANGRAVYVETRVSSGDSALDERAQQMVLKKWSFPKGAPDTQLVTVKAKDVPKP